MVVSVLEDRVSHADLTSAKETLRRLRLLYQGSLQPDANQQSLYVLMQDLLDAQTPVVHVAMILLCVADA